MQKKDVNVEQQSGVVVVVDFAKPAMGLLVNGVWHFALDYLRGVVVGSVGAAKPKYIRPASKRYQTPSSWRPATTTTTRRDPCGVFAAVATTIGGGAKEKNSYRTESVQNVVN